MPVVNGIDTVSRELVLTEDQTQQKEFAKQVYGTAIGQRFKRDFEKSDSNLAIVLESVWTRHPGATYITVSMYLRGLEAAMNRGKMTRKPTTPTPAAAQPEPEVPRDKNNRPLTQAQIRWGEYQRFLAERSSAEVAERRRTDPGFREFCQHDLRKQMSQPIDGAVVAQDDIRPAVDFVVTHESQLDRLKKFAADFNALSAAEARKKMLPGFNPQWEAFSRDFEQCRALRLL